MSKCQGCGTEASTYGKGAPAGDHEDPDNPGKPCPDVGIPTE
jgi:hypothetical protein